MELLMRPSATGMQPAVLLAVALMCSHMQGIAACRDFRSPILTSGGLLAASAGEVTLHEIATVQSRRCILMSTTLRWQPPAAVGLRPCISDVCKRTKKFTAMAFHYTGLMYLSPQ